MPTYLTNTSNPYSESIVRKEQIDISISLSEVSASGHKDQIQTTYAKDYQVVTIPEQNYLNSSSYYTPIYKEQLNYNVWLTRVNKNFEELI